MNNTVCVADVHKELPAFVGHLLGMEPRIRLHVFYDDLDNKPGYFPTHQHLYMTYGFPNAAHEISHTVEMETPERWIQPDWGFKHDTHFLERASKSGLFVAAEREARVRGIQSLLSSDVRSVTNNIYWLDKLAIALPYKHFSSLEEVKQWLDGVHLQTMTSWSLDRIEDAWKKRLLHIQHWMESEPQ